MTLGVIFSSDKMYISIITRNHMAHLILISLTNIDVSIHNKTLLHRYLLLALLPTKFLNKNTCVCSLLQDWLTHQVLNKLLSPLKIAAAVGVMMSDPVDNLRYCFTPLASWIADTPKERFFAATGLKTSPVTTATSKEFGNLFCHAVHMSTITLTAIEIACAEYSPSDYKEFLKVIRQLCLNGIIEPF